MSKHRSPKLTTAPSVTTSLTTLAEVPITLLRHLAATDDRMAILIAHLVEAGLCRLNVEFLA